MICALCAGRKLELEPGQRLELCFAHALEHLVIVDDGSMAAASGGDQVVVEREAPVTAKAPSTGLAREGRIRAYSVQLVRDGWEPAAALERARQAYEEPLGESATARQRAPSELRWSQAQRRERLEEAAASRPGASYGSV